MVAGDEFDDPGVNPEGFRLTRAPPPRNPSKDPSRPGAISAARELRLRLMCKNVFTADVSFGFFAIRERGLKVVFCRRETTCQPVVTGIRQQTSTSTAVIANAPRRDWRADFWRRTETITTTGKNKYLLYDGGTGSRRVYRSRGGSMDGSNDGACASADERVRCAPAGPRKPVS